MMIMVGEPNGLLTQLEKFDTFFDLTSCPIPDIYSSGTEQTLTNVQYKNTLVQVALSCVDIYHKKYYLNQLRSDDSFRE